MKKLLLLVLMLLCLVIQVHSNCFQVAQEFNCAFERSLTCNGDDGQCDCKDGTVCKWKGKEPLNDNCPCDKPAPRRKKRRRDRDDM